MKAPYFAFYPGDYLADTMGLSCCEHGVYLLLLAVSWQRGPLPDDLDHLSRLAANPPMEVLRYILTTYWTLEDRGWINARLELERRKLEELKARQSAAGKRAIAARWSKSDTNRIRGEYESNTNQNQNQKEDIEETTSPCPQKSADARIPRCPHQQIIDLYHQHLPRNPKVRSWTGQRPKALAARWKDHPEVAWWDGFFGYVAESKFLTGRTDSPFMPDLEWLIRLRNHQKIIEGQYHR